MSDNIPENIPENEMEALLKSKQQEIENLKREREDLKKKYNENQIEHEKELAELNKKIDELVKEIDALIQNSPVHVGKLIKPTKPGWVLILDNHRVEYEVRISNKIKEKDLKEGSQVSYTVDPVSGKPRGVFKVEESRHNEEIAIIEAVNDDNKAARIILQNSSRQAEISRHIKVKLEKGDEVYYDPIINFITGKVPKNEEKVDLRRVERKTWQDIGGLKEQVRKVREIVELHFKYPEFFKVKGILLTGPPGCGKTLISKVLANEVDLPLLSLAGPEIVTPYVGESEARLRQLFDSARLIANENGRGAIIFIDEIESISEKRDQAEHGHERRLVSQLLALMDGLTSVEKVIVIAATNKPNLLDEALRRPGRFTEEIEIPVPDANGRLEILKIHARNMPLAPDVSLEKLAEETHGFTGADLEGLCQKSVYLAFKNVALEDIDAEACRGIKVTKEHFNFVFQAMKPSVMREITFQKPKETWADVGGLEEVKQKLEEAIKWPLIYPELMKKAGYVPPRGILLYGPSGTGKTLVARALSNECGVNFIPVKGPELINKYVGESEKNVREIFKRARQAAPCVIFFDEIESLVSMRGTHSGDAGVSDKVTAQLLTELDGIESMKGVFVLAATNRIDLVDPSLLRSGRFDYKIYLPPPGKEARLKIFKIHTQGKPLSDDIDFEKLGIKTEPVLLGKETLPSGETFELRFHFTGAEIANICQRASQIALGEFIATRDPQKDYQDFKVYIRHFNEALEQVIPSEASAKDTQAIRKKDKTETETEEVKRIKDEDIKEVM